MEQWSSKFGFILAAVGAAVGVGNIWRFPAVVGQNGGGAYLVPYLVAVFALGIPLLMLEIAVGRRWRHDVVNAFRTVLPGFRFIGWFLCAVVFVILSYYLVVVGWTLAYTGYAVAGTTPDFGTFTASWTPLVTFLVTAVATGAIVALGVRAGIERAASVLMPFAFLILIALAVFVTTLDGFGAGLAFYLTPDFTVLGDPSLWAAAFGQAFFSVGIGWGIMITYGTYLGENASIARSAVLITLADLFVALIAGFVIFPVVMTFGFEPGAGAELAFTTLPRAFDLIPGGAIMGVGFFLVLLLAGLTSAIAIMEVMVAALVGTTRFTRKRASVLVTGALILAGFPSALSYSPVGFNVLGQPLLDFLDVTVATIGLPVIGILTAIAFTWFMGRRFLDEELHVDRSPVLRVVYPTVRYALPVLLGVVTVTSIANALAGAGREPFAMAAAAVGLIIMAFAVLRAYRGSPRAPPAGE